VDDFAAKVFPHLLADWGYGAIAAAVIADSFGVPVPGEVMVLLAAVYAGATHHLSLPGVIAAAGAGAILGDNITYALGRHGGYPLVKRYGWIIHLDARRLTIGRYLFRCHGGSVVWLGRLVPVAHIWTAALAGVNRMPWPRFVLANAAGAVVWATGLSLAGYLLGKTALRLGALLVGAAVPLAVIVGLAVLLLLRARERSLYEAATRMTDGQQDHAA
jgi:membrane protein DedA with SNARE-associated domain